MNTKRNRESRGQYGPRLAGEILHDYLENSNEPLAVAYREHHDEAEAWHANTDLCVNLKTILCSGKRMEIGKNYTGVLRLDSEPIVDEFLCRDPHYTFVESAQSTKVCHRNPYHYQGQHVSCTISPDGKPRLNFKQMKLDADFDKYRYAREVMNEVIQALDLSGL